MYNKNRNYNRRRNNGNRGNRENRSYVWVVYNYDFMKNKVFTNKVSALKYYYEHEFSCARPEKMDGRY